MLILLILSSWLFLPIANISHILFRADCLSLYHLSKLCDHVSTFSLPHENAYWWFIPWFVSGFRRWRKDLSINRMNRQLSPATPHNSIYLLYIFQLKPFRTFIWNHALELLKITRHIERDTVPTPLPSKLLWLKMTFLDQNISKSNSETAILLLMEKVETL